MWRLSTAGQQRERPVNPERSRSSLAAALEASQRSFESAGDRSKAATHDRLVSRFSDHHLFPAWYVLVVRHDFNAKLCAEGPIQFQGEARSGNPAKVSRSSGLIVNERDFRRQRFRVGGFLKWRHLDGDRLATRDGRHHFAIEDPVATNVTRGEFETQLDHAHFAHCTGCIALAGSAEEGTFSLDGAQIILQLDLDRGPVRSARREHISSSDIGDLHDWAFGWGRRRQRVGAAAKSDNRGRSENELRKIRFRLTGVIHAVFRVKPLTWPRWWIAELAC